ncbi:unnamed protein product [Ambrosiozyma monospora]|uniref:Unnamed protein product n=1 Tax=Ambrosiozyma monospora TaxID=43982 RepID=A0ACB5T9M0_AMBMO|nr:unnamed protein product [Ambrosiozyma monospora]
MISYEQLLPIGALMIISSLSFVLGVLFSNWPYDYYTLWDASLGEEHFTRALEHYKNWATAPSIITYVLHGVLVITFIGCLIKIFKPTEDTKYFEYGSLAAFVGAASIYLTNVRVGAYSALNGEWGEVDQNTGLAVIAASETMIVFLIFGIILLQCGLFYAHYEDSQLKIDFYIKELQEKLAAAEAGETAPVAAKDAAAPVEKAKATGVSSNKTKATKSKKKT